MEEKSTYVSDDQGIINIDETKKYSVTNILPSQDSISIKFGDDSEIFDVYDSMTKILQFINVKHKTQLSSSNKKSRKRAKSRQDGTNKPYITVSELLKYFTDVKEQNPMELFTLDVFIWENNLYSCNNRRLCLINMLIRHSKKNNNLKFIGGGIKINLLDNKKPLNDICHHDFTYIDRLKLRNIKNYGTLPQEVTSKDGHCLSGSRHHIGGKSKSRTFKKKRKNKKKRKSVKKRL